MLQQVMKLETLFSQARFVRAVVDSGAGKFTALTLKVNPGDPDCRMHTIAEQCRFGRRRVHLGPFGLYASPGVEDDLLDQALGHIIRQLEGIRTVSFVWNVRFDHKPLAEGLAKLGISATQTMTHVLSIRGDYESSTFSGFSQTNRNKIRRAKRAGVTVRRAGCLEDIRAYHAIHRKLAS